MPPRAATDTQPSSKRSPSTDADTRGAVAKPVVKTSKTGSVSPRKQSSNDGKARDTKQVQKACGENLTSKPGETTRRVTKRGTTDLGVSARKSQRDGSSDLTSVRSSKRSEKPSSRSSSGGRQGVRKPQQRSATDLTQSSQHIDTSQQSLEEVSTVIMLL